MWPSLCNEDVDSAVCHPEGIKACVSREKACPLLSGYSVDKVTTDTKIDKKLASKVVDCEWVFNDVTKLRNESAMAEDHCKARDLTVRFWESDNAEIQVTHVQVHLKQNLGFWKDVLQAPPPILDCIESGYHLPLKFIPPSWSQPNHQSARSHRDFVDEVVESLVHNCCIARVQEMPHLCSPLAVVANSAGKLHLVLGLKHLNKFLHVVS